MWLSTVNAFVLLHCLASERRFAAITDTTTTRTMPFIFSHLPDGFKAFERPEIRSDKR